MNSHNTPSFTNYYDRFKLLTHSPLWNEYITWGYSACVNDLKKIGVKTDLGKRNFSCLLCGVSGEVTADAFIRFILQKNPYANITIIDQGGKQISAVKKLIAKKYKKENISALQINALTLVNYFPEESFDWIETDGFIEYFDDNNLKSLLSQWRKLIKKDGFITTREFASDSFIDDCIDRLRFFWGKTYLQVIMHKHTKKQLDMLFEKHGFKFVSGKTVIPTFRRYALAPK